MGNIIIVQEVPCVEITGKELERALLKTQGRTWDGVPLPKLSVSDLKQDAIQLFKDKAVKRGGGLRRKKSVWKILS